MRKAPDDVMEIFLQPGECWFGDSNTRIRTILGSCVSITAWHPRLRIGGMCHYLVPTRRTRGAGTLDGKHGDEALLLLKQAAEQRKTDPHDYELKIFGGGNMFGGGTSTQAKTIGEQNACSGLQMLQAHGFHVVSQHLRGEGHRQIIFDVWSGDVWVRQHALMPAQDAKKMAA